MCATTCAPSGRWATSRTSQVEVSEDEGSGSVGHLRAQGKAGHPQDLRRRQRRGRAVDKINEVLDIKKDQILDLAKVKKNVEKIKDALRREGLLHGGGHLRDQARHAPRRSTSGSTSTRTPRSRCGRSTSSATSAISDDELRERHLHAGGELALAPHLGGDLPRGRLPARPAPHPGPLLGPRLRAGQGRQPAGRAVARQAVDVHHHPRRRGAAVPARQGRRQGRPAHAQGVLPRAGVGQDRARSSTAPSCRTICRS